MIEGYKIISNPIYDIVVNYCKSNQPRKQDELLKIINISKRVVDNISTNLNNWEKGNKSLKDLFNYCK